VIAAAIFLGLNWAAGNIDQALQEGAPTYGDLFDFYSAISILFIALAGPQLLIPDRTKGVLSVYFSRPLTVDGYLTSKMGAFATVVGAIYIVPQLLLHLGLALISDDGFLPYLGDNLDILWKVPVTTLAFIGLHGSVIFILSSVIDRTGIAAASFLGILVAGGGVAGRVAEATFPGARYASLLAVDQHPRIIRDYLFENTVEYPAEIAGFEVWVSVVVIVVLFVVGAWFVRQRYKKLA
jgi:ABC-type transport system involved in multi-copper enzyme maturation permease subunit